MQSTIFSPQAAVLDPRQPIMATTATGIEQTWRPMRQWNLGLGQNVVGNQIQQVKSAVTKSAAGGSQGIPKPVQNVRVTRTPINSTLTRVSVSFTPDPSDPYFQGVSVSIVQGTRGAVGVASGKSSPITFITQRTSAASSVAVQSIGSFANTSQGSSPGKAFSLL